jgi:3-oxoacyl-[acyl-carrier protein] reductase
MAGARREEAEVDLGLGGKVALVTASSKGLGRASALALSQEGAKVVLCARDRVALEETAAAMPGEALAVPADVTDPATPRRLAEAAVDRFGGLHVLVANAGGPPPARALEVDDQALQAALQANLLSSIRLVQAALPHMRAAGWGRICLITSKAVKEPIPALALSNTARTGLWAWAKTAAADLFDEGITLNLACPGTHDTDRARQAGMLGDGPVGDPADFGKVVCFLCSAPARFVSGTALLVDGATTRGLL